MFFCSIYHAFYYLFFKKGGEDQYDSLGISATENYKNQYQISALFVRVLFLRLTNQGKKAALDCLQIEKELFGDKISKHRNIQKKIERIFLHLFLLVVDYFPQRDDGFIETLMKHLTHTTTKFYSVRRLTKQQTAVNNAIKKLTSPLESYANNILRYICLFFDVL